MLARGDWIVPTFNGELRDHKPILLYWGQMASYLSLGESDFSARLPSAIAALLTVMAVAVLASRLSGMPQGISRYGFWSAAALSTCLLFVMAGRAATPDACLIAFSTLGIAALVVASLAPALPYSSGAVTQARWLPASVGYLMLGLAALAKGPVGIVLPLAVVHLWWLICWRIQQTPTSPAGNPTPQTLAGRAVWCLQEAWQTFHPWRCWQAVWALRTLPGVLLALLAAAPWYVAVGLETEGAFLRGFFWEHNVGRAMNSMEGHGGNVLFYPLALIVGTFPWSLWLIPIIAWSRRAAAASVVQRQMIVLAASWIAVYVGAFTVASTKLPSYITPCFAGAALLIGGYLAQFETAWARPSKRWRTIAYGITTVSGLGIAVAMIWLSRNESMPLLARSSAGGLVIAALGILGFAWERRQQLAWLPTTWLVGAAAFQVILFGFGARSVDRYRQDLCLLTTVQQQSGAKHWLAIGGMEPSWVHYLGNEIVEVTDSPNSADAWRRVQDFLRSYPDGLLIVVGEQAQSQLTAFAPLEPLEQVESAPRFLRPGSLAIYRQSFDPPRHELQLSSTEPPSPSKTVGASRPAVPQPPTNEVAAEGASVSESATVAERNERSNPLRPSIR